MPTDLCPGMSQVDGKRTLKVAIVGCGSAGPAAATLRAYSRRRRRVLRYYGFSTRQLTPWFQSDYEFLDPIRHFFFRLMQCLPPARKFMTRTMAGMVGGQASQHPKD